MAIDLTSVLVRPRTMFRSERAARRGRPLIGLALEMVLWCAVIAASARAQILEKEVPAQARGLEIKERLGEQVPLELQFTTADGKTDSLGDYFGKGSMARIPKPAIIVIGYYDCPVVCPAVLSKLVGDCLNKLDLTVGKDFNVLVYSINPREDVERAARARDIYLGAYDKGREPGVREGFIFHAGDDAATRQVAQAVGFPYRKLDNGEYSHPVGLFILTPEGKVSRYVYGYTYEPKDFKLALLEASQGKLAKSIGDYFIHFCYRYDPTAGRYTLHAVRVMQICGVVTLVGLGGLIGGLRLAEIVRRRQARLDGAGGAGAAGGGSGVQRTDGVMDSSAGGTPRASSEMGIPR